MRISSLRRREQVLVVLADELDQQVERAGHDHEVVDLGERGEAVGDGADVTLDADADHRHAPEPEHHRVGDGDDLGDPDLDQPAHALAHRRLGQPDLLRELRVRPTAVVLERFDEGLVDVVERDGSGRFGHRSRMTRGRPAPQAIRRPDRSPSWIRQPSGFPAANPCVACRRVRAVGRLVPRAPALARRRGARGDDGAGAGAAPGGRRRGGDRRRLLRGHRRRRPGPTGSAGRRARSRRRRQRGEHPERRHGHPGAQARTGRAGPPPRRHRSGHAAGDARRVRVRARPRGERGDRVRLAGVRWAPPRPSSAPGAGVAAGGRRVGRGRAAGAVARRRRPRVGDRLGRVRRRAADGTDGRGAAGEAPRRVRRAGRAPRAPRYATARGRRASSDAVRGSSSRPRAAPSPRATSSWPRTPTSMACSRPSSSVCCRWGASSSPPSPSRRSGRDR